VFESAQGADNKALSAACVAAKTAYPESKGQMAFCRDTDSDKFTCVAVLPGTANAAKVRDSSSTYITAQSSANYVFIE
jgi:hypothetical protein